MSWNLVQHFSDMGNVVVHFIIPFLVLLTVIVFIHELGHFLVARWCGIKILVCSDGFGPEVGGFTDRHGTRWKISYFPLGGYVKFFGDENAASVPDADAIAAMNAEERKVSFFHKPVWARAAVVAAGPLANFLLAIVIFATIFSIYGKEETAARVDQVMAGSAAEVGGFKPGDLVLSINGRSIESFRDMQEIVSLNADERLAFVVERGGAKVQLHATPRLTTDKDIFGNVYRIGRLGISQTNSPQDIRRIQYGPVGALQDVLVGGSHPDD